MNEFYDPHEDIDPWGCFDCANAIVTCMNEDDT